MDLAAWQKINVTSDRVDALEKRMNEPSSEAKEMLERLEKLEGEIRAMKARMGKKEIA